MQVIYPGTFDPLTNGHVEIVKRSISLFDGVIVAVAKNAGKKPSLSFSERFELCCHVFAGFPTVLVEGFQGLLVDYAREKKIKTVIRGLRSASDLDYESQLATMNQQMAPEIETLFMLSSAAAARISSSIVREIGLMGGDVSLFVPPAAVQKLKK